MSNEQLIWILCENQRLLKGKNTFTLTSRKITAAAKEAKIKPSLIKTYWTSSWLNYVAENATNGDVIIIVCSTIKFYQDVADNLVSRKNVFPIYVFCDYDSEHERFAKEYLEDIDDAGNPFLPLRVLFFKGLEHSLSKLLVIADHCRSYISSTLTTADTGKPSYFRLFCMGDFHIGQHNVAPALTHCMNDLPLRAMPDSVAILGDIFNSGIINDNEIDSVILLLSTIYDRIRETERNYEAPLICVFGDHDMEKSNPVDEDDNNRIYYKTKKIIDILNNKKYKLPHDIWSGYSTANKAIKQEWVDDSPSPNPDAKVGLAAGITCWPSSPRHTGYILSDSVIPYFRRAQKKLRDGQMLGPVARKISLLADGLLNSDENDKTLSVLITLQHHPFTHETTNIFGPYQNYDYGAGADPYNKQYRIREEGEINLGKHILIHGHTHFSHITPDPIKKRITIGVPTLGINATQQYDGNDLYGFLSINIVSISDSKYILLVNKHNFIDRDRFAGRMITPSRLTMITFTTNSNGEISEIDDNILSVQTSIDGHKKFDAYFINEVKKFKYDIQNHCYNEV